MIEGNFVRVKFGGRKDKTYNRKAILLSIQGISYGDALINKYEIKMVKTGEIIECIKNGLESWI